MISNQLLRLHLLKKCLISNESHSSAIAKVTFRTQSTHAALDRSSSKVFFSEKAQTLMKKLTGFQLQKINRRRATEKISKPAHKFMTTEMLERAKTVAVARSAKRLQCPPLVPINYEEPEILDAAPEMIGFTNSKYVFTDISYTVKNKDRLVVVREPDGVLRRANSFEKHRMNQIYFPQPGREFRHPKMFEKENLQVLFEKKEYEFILDRACAQFEPDNQEYHEITFETFKTINENRDYTYLESTRHYGNLVFYLCLNKNLDSLLKQYLNNNQLSYAVAAVELYELINPDSKFASLKLNSDENQVKYIEAFADNETTDPEGLKSYLVNYSNKTEKESE